MSVNEKEQCEPCGSGAGSSPALRGFGFRVGLSLAFAGQGMVFSLGYNNASRMGDAPVFGSLTYWILHGGLLLSSLVVVALLGGPLFLELWNALRSRRLSVEALFLLSGLGALGGSLVSTVRGSGSLYYEVVSIVLCVYAIGKQVGALQRGRLGMALAGFKETFNRATIIDANGEVQEIGVDQLREGDRVRIGPGEPVPVDGLIVEGQGYVRETALTGEPVPISLKVGERIRGGTWSVDGAFVVVPDLGHPREVESVLALLNQAPVRPSRLQEISDRLMQWFVPLVSIVSFITFLVWWLYGGLVWEGVFNAMAVLLVACPCALGLAMPSGLWAGLYYLSQHGLVGRHGRLIDALAHGDTIVFDKTGTLTEFEEGVETDALESSDPKRLLAAVDALARVSKHPVSEALRGLSKETLAVTGFKLHPGEGLEGMIEGRRVLCGEKSLLLRHAVSLPSEWPPIRGKPVYLSEDGQYCGFLVLRERLREESEATLQALQELGCRCYIFSGDPAPATPYLAGVEVEGRLSAREKADRVTQLQKSGRKVVFIGDGVNDLEAMQVAEAALAIDAGVALATESADGVLLGGQVSTLPFAIRKARQIRRHLEGNLRFALTYNLAGITFAACGFLHPVGAALLMVGSSLIVSFRAIRAAALS